MKLPELYPLLPERQLVYRLWGGTRILEWLELPPPPIPHIGETWEVFDKNRIRNGVLAGQTLAEATRQYGEHLVGTRVVAQYGADFCLLIKFIDTNDTISLQVHPDDTYAHTRERETGFHGKTEAWYILDATPGSGIIYGMKERVTPEQFLTLVESGEIVSHVQHIPVYRGDTSLILPGIIHGMDAGLLLYEVQQKSDLTYRVYDYGRRDPVTGQLRDLHLKKAMDIFRYDPSPIPRTYPIPLDSSGHRMLMLACRHFALEQWRVQRAWPFCPDPASMEILTLIEGGVRLLWERGALDLKAGDSVVLPASLGAASLYPVSTASLILRVYVPDLEQIWQLLKQKRWSDPRIAQVVFDG